MAAELERRIRDRTLSGHFGSNSTGKYTIYEPEYASRKGKPQSPVTLHDTGTMLGGMIGKVSFPSGGNMAIGMTFSGERSRKIAEFLQFFGIKAGGDLKRREFLYLEENDLDEMMSIAAKELGITITR